MNKGLEFFKEKTPGEKVQKKVSKELSGALNSMRRCLNDEKFLDYAKKYKCAEDVIIAKLIDFDEPDPMRYALGVKDVLARLQIARSLLKDVTKDFDKIKRQNKRAGENNV